MSLDILIFGAHADDAEIGMAGTIAKHTSAGLKVGICDLTRAEMSSNGDVDTRQAEAEAASSVLGLSARTNLGLPDRGLMLNQDHISAVTAEIRRHAPRIVFAPYWEDRHPDHVMCSKIVEEAVFNAKLRRYMPELPSVQVSQLYFYFINDVGKTDLVVDITEYYGQKEASLQCYQSQFEAVTGTNQAQTVSTPLNQGYMERIKARDSLLGQRMLIPFAEGFASKTPFVVSQFG
ncbi:bacillithiol biosynthesis deacetylase BshB1 [Paenibacillus sp. JX-17]|uniref:Bacillithiol biosynthesis deacetylase BshB1 n=1 Tax=Paenibacillus lacisoli TaxID=3064525 RepID=A0ABT9CBP8_9BACL|nr:bacillithiol biosynthesis deacetylase BshB1 [Paenibacillus sp. JX-17]MDO7905038.1 bacillithiol biosynthesis deacetylase BshB1 [Paenibacillus sp. JX-17]